LRGPDVEIDNNDIIKKSFTAPFRNAIGINCNDHYGRQSQMISILDKRKLTKEELKLNYHFYNHYNVALDAYRNLYQKDFYEKEKII
jgi:hypothetical protein